jgi:cytochrome c peroxidase
MPGKQAVCLHVQKSKYATLFEQAWGPGSLDCSAAGASATYDKFGLSMGAYQASAEVSPFSSKFDAYWHVCIDAGNDPEACGTAEGVAKVDVDPQGILSDQEFAGLIEFGEYCAACHESQVPGPKSPPLFTDNTFHNLGVPKNPENPFYRMDQEYLDDGSPINPLGAAWIDYGLGAFLAARPEFAHLAYDNDGKMRVPTVRNVDMRTGKGFPKAYMHNGVFKSLEEVVHFYNTRDVVAEGWAPPEVERNVSTMELVGKPLGNLELSAEAEAAIVAFPKTLTDGYER